jgi:hypothetical protein
VEWDRQVIVNREFTEVSIPRDVRLEADQTVAIQIPFDAGLDRADEERRAPLSGYLA